MDFGIMGGAGAPNEPKLLYVSLKRKQILRNVYIL